MLKNPRNFRVDPTLPLIVETDASKKAIGAALILEVKTEEVTERRLKYTASRSLKSAETRYSTRRRELLGVSFALKNFRKFLMGNHFLVRTDHRPWDGLFTKAITSIENEDSRDLVAGLTEDSFDVEYVPGESNCFPDWLSSLEFHDDYSNVQGHKECS